MTTSSRPQPPKRHHYLPASFQRFWAGPDRLVERFAPGHDGKIRAKRLSPTAIGWMENLYRIPGETDEWEAQRVETKFFARLDDAAISVMRDMINSGKPPRTGEQRSAWASFLIAFLHRTPEHLTATFGKLKELNEELMPEAERGYAELKGPNDPTTFEEWCSDHAGDAVERSMFRTIMNLITSPKVGPYLINLAWAVIDVTRADHSLMLGDNPVILVPLGRDDGHIAIPMGPDHVFLASRHAHWVREVQRAQPGRIVRIVNRLMVERANQFVIAKDRSQEQFVQKHFGTRRIGSLATGLG